MDYYLMNKDNIIFRFNISRDALSIRYSLIKSNYTRKKLIKAQDFKFKSIGVKRADERLTLLNIIVKYRVKECLKV